MVLLYPVASFIYTLGLVAFMKLEWLGASSAAGIGMQTVNDTAKSCEAALCVKCCFVVCLSIVHFYRRQQEKNRAHHEIRRCYDSTVWPKACFGDIILQCSQF